MVYSGFKYKVIISQQYCQHSPFEINKHQYSSININMKVLDTGLNKGLLFFNNQPFVSLIMIFDGYLEQYFSSVIKNKTDSNS